MTRTRLSCDHFLFFDFRTLTFDSLRTPIAALFCDTLSLLYTHFANSFRRTVPRDFPAGHPFYLLLRRPVTLLLSQSHALSITQFIDKTRKQTTKTKTTKQQPQNEAYDYFYDTFLRYMTTGHEFETGRDRDAMRCDAGEGRERWRERDAKGERDGRARGRRRQEGGAREPRRSDLRPRPAKRDCEDRPQHSRAPGSRYVRANSGAAIAARLRRAPRREREAPTGSCGAQSTPARRTRESRRPPRRSAGREREPNRPGRPHRSPGRCTPPPGRGRR